MGTAMGTPCACIYASVFFAYFEMKYILKKYKNNFILYKRQIDNIFGIWIPYPSFPNAWEEFNRDLNNYSSLHWNTETLSNKVNFLDVTMWIGPSSKVQYRTYQKPMNLFLYIPPNSARPSGVLQSLIHSLIQTYKCQNTSTRDFKHFVNLLYKQLRARGHTQDSLLPVFTSAAKSINHCTSTTPDMIAKTKLKTKQLLFHLKYHPKGIS